MKLITTFTRAKHLVWALLLVCFCTLNASAQKMEFTFSNLSGVKTQYLHDGTTLVQLPVGSSLASLSTYGMSVKADGQTATLSDIVPNPSSTTFTDGVLNVLYYKGKSYKVRFAVGEYFTAVLFSDAKLGSANALSKADLTAMAERITKMGKTDGVNYEFESLPGYTPTTDIAIYLGDMNATTSPSPIIHTLGNDYMNIVNKCAVVAGQIESTGTSASITEYGLCYGTSANPTTSNTYKAAADLGGTDGTFGDAFQNVFGVYFDNLTGETTYHVRAYCKYTLSGSSTVLTTYGEDRTFTTPPVSGFSWHWEGGETPSAEAKARIEEAMNGASDYYNHYCTLAKWCGTAYVSGVQTADCSLRSDNSCYIRFGPGERYQWVGTAQHEISHGYGVGQTRAFSGYANPFNFKVATLTLRVFLKDMTMLISHDGQHYWPGGINQREEVTNGTANSKGTYTCKNEEMLKCNAMILNGMAKDGMQTTYGWAKSRDGFEDDGEGESLFAKPRAVSGSNATDFEDALNAFNQAGIPLILAPGDVDLAATASSDGYTLNGNTYSVITRSIEEAQTHGVTDVSRFSGTTLSNTTQPQPYAFLFKGVRFYNGMKLWFDKPMYRYSNSSYRYLTPDQILSNLTTYVSSHSSETSVWLQHIPFNADDNTWLDNTGTVYRYNNGTTAYNNNTYNATYNAYNTAARRRTKLSTLINSTAHASMFSGHAGTYNDNHYNNQFHDYTVAALNNTPCDAYIVLMKAGTGVVEVKSVSFRDYQPYVVQYDDPATEYTAGENNAVLAGLVQGMTNLNTGNAVVNSAVGNAKNVTTATNVTSSITAINNAFNTWAQAQGGNVDVSALLGGNLNFEKPAGTSTSTNIHAITDWNEWVNVSSTGNAYLQYKTDLSSPNGGNALYIRENWKGNPALASTLQVYKDAVLPAGTYLLQFQMRVPGEHFSESLNYYELNGVRTTFSAGSNWETKTIQLTVSTPTTFRLSFGFKGGDADGDRPCEVDVDGITLMWTPQAMAEGKASMADGWTKLTAKPSDYSPYFFAIYDHSQDLGMVQKTGSHQGADNKAMWYQSNVTPGIDKTALWTFDSNVDGNTEYVVMANASYPDYMMQTEWNKAWNFRTSDNGGGDISWGRTLISYADSKWTVQNGYYPDAGYLGPWDNTIQDGAETALNKTDSNVGYFDIYSMLRGEYVARYEMLDAASVDHPVDISYVLGNPGGERRSSIGWKTDGAGWWSQGSTALNGKVGAYFLENWNGSGLPATDLYQVVQGLPNGRYKFSAIAHCTSNCNMYVNDQMTPIPTNNPGTRTELLIILSGGTNTLRVGFKTGTNPGSWIAFDDARLEFLGVPDSYFVGEPVISIADNAYIQDLQTVTFNYNLASSTDGTPLALLSSTAKATLKKGNATVAQGTLSLSGNVVTATFPAAFTLDAGSDYTLTLPAGAVGYAGQASNDAVTLTLHTPILFDTTCYLYNESTQKYLSRNGLWNTQAVPDDYGLAIEIVTDEQGGTHLRLFDNHLYVFSDGSNLFADGGTPIGLTPVAVSGKYRFVTADGKYLCVNGSVIGLTETAGASSLWTLEPTADHPARYAALADAQAATAASAAGLTNVTTLAQLEAHDFLTDEIAVTGAKEEKFQQYAPIVEAGDDLDYYTETLDHLTPGLYRLSVDAFQRAAYNEWVAAADGARGLIFLFANGAQTQLKSVMDYGAATAYSNDFEYNGLHYPNDEISAYAALETGNYQNVVYVNVPADGTLTFGIRILNRMGNNVSTGTWAAYQNFKLEYLMPMVVLDETATTAPAAATNVAVRLVRTLVGKDNATSGKAWNTVCFPFGMTADQITATFGKGTMVKSLDSVTKNGESASLTFAPVTEIVANTPYIMQLATAPTTNEYILRGVNVTPTDEPTVTVGDIQFVGNYVKDHVMANNGGEDYYLLNDAFKHSTGNTKIKGYRAYFHVPATSGIKSLGFDPATGIDEVQSTEDEESTTVYDLSGRRVARPSKGMYIVNGKKVFVK